MKEVTISIYFGFCIFLFKLSLPINCIYILTEFACSGAFKSIFLACELFVTQLNL